jgi:glycosyltransferase involved in cell wall biosynthesis
MSSKPLLSIITPVFNGEKYINETISSVLNADIAVPYEYIVLNDGSDDSTAFILDKFKHQIKVLSHTNIGESATVNRGIKVAQGDFIVVISADDPLLTGDLLTEACGKLAGEPGLVALYPDWKIINELGETIFIKNVPEYSDDVMIGQCRCLPGPGTVFRKDAALQVGGRREKWKYVGDYDFWLRLSRVGNIRKLSGFFAQWRQSMNSTSISQRGVEMANERIRVIEEFLKENELPIYLCRNARGNSHYLASRLAFFDSRINGKRLLFSAFKFQKGWPSQAKILVVMYLLLTPISAIAAKPVKDLILRKNSYK